MNELVALVNTNQVKPSIAPIAFDYLYEPLVQAGFRVGILDLCFEDNVEEAVATFCASTPPAFWGITVRNTDDTYFASQHSFLPLVQGMIETIKRYSSAPIVMGGVGFSIMPEKILEYCGGDFGITCEGEVSFPLLLTRLLKHEAYEDIPGLVYRTPQGYKRNPLVFSDLVQVGSHCRKLIDNEHYFQKGGQIGIETKRGCSRVCIYCVELIVKGRKVRLRDPVHVVDEIEELVKRGITAFHINDSEFNLDIRHALAFCEEIQRRRLQHSMQWYAYGMPTPFPDILAESMRAAGCAGMNFGVDAASEKMLRVLKRTFRPYHIARAVETCKRYHLPYMLELLLGGPGETTETVRETIEFIKNIDAERVAVTVGLRVFPGTELARIVCAEGLSADNPNLYGAIEGNDDFMQPLFYISSDIAPDPLAYIRALIGDDKRFFGVNTNNMNYNANQLLVNAIAQGERGAYWAILSKIANICIGDDESM